MTNPQDQPELIPYASHVAHGTGRTPIGIILFAASHLLLGAVVALALSRFVGRVGRNDWGLMIFAGTLALGSVSMMVGGIALLIKGRSAWCCSVIAFACVAVSESLTAAIYLVDFYDYPWPYADYDWRVLFRRSFVLAAVAAALLVLCLIVLRYLSSEKARATFALPPGEAPAVVRWLPRAIVVFFLLAAMLGRKLGLMFAP